MIPDDPFSPDADPYPLVSSVLTRRDVLRLAVLAPAVVATTGCLVRRLACDVQPQNPLACQQRFCRYYRPG